jgi:hypothetical protein
MSGVSVDVESPRSELDVAFAGGQGFIDRIIRLEKAKAAHDESAKAAGDRISVAEQREQRADEIVKAAKAQAAQIIAEANGHAAELGRLSDADRKQLESDRERHGRAAASKSAELEQAQHEAAKAKADAEQLQKKLTTKLAALNAAIGEF